jgi:polyhydroxybutyrate depolymerase
LVLSFHGRHGQGKGQAKLTGFSEVADRHGFIVVYPDGIDKSWNAMHGAGPAQEKGVDDVGFVDALIDRLQAEYAIDPNRVYAAGMSNGGFFSHRLGCELSTRLAAIASVAGQMGPELAEICDPAEPVAVLDIHGTKDRIVPYDGGETKGGGALLSVEDTVDTWRQLNDCAMRSDVTLDKGDASCRTYRGCSAPVELCTIEGAGHTWPGGHQYMPRLLVGTTNRDVDASELIWEFFENNPKRTSIRRGSGRKQPAERKK